MLQRLQRFFDVRPGEALPVLLTFLYLALVIAAFLLAKPIRNALFLNQFGAYRLVYVYVGVPVALAGFVPLYTWLAARVGRRTLITGSLVFFALNVIAFWYLFTFHPFPVLRALFYIWVNCFGAIAAVQVWTFANSVLDTRQAKRLFGLIGSGASAGAILGGLLAQTLVGPLGGPVNLLLVLAGLIAAAAVIVNLTRWVIPRRTLPAGSAPVRVPFLETLGFIRRTRYLQLISAMVFLVAIVTQWTQFQFSLVADQRFAGDAERLTRFFGAFNTYLGIVAFAVQLLLTGTVLRRFGMGLTIVLLPTALGLGSTAILLAPVLWTVTLTNALDQSLRFSIDKATFELLYLPIAPSIKANVKATIDIVVSRFADGVGGLLLGLVTGGFNLMVVSVPGAGFGLRGTAAINLVFVGIWLVVAVALRRGYVEAIRESIQQHRLDSEQTASTVLDRSTTDLLAAKLRAEEPEDILYALDFLEAQHDSTAHPVLRSLLRHRSAVVRRRALGLLSAAGDRSAVPDVEALLLDDDLETRTEALLFLAYHAGIDPVARIQSLGDFSDFSIRAGMVVFLARPGRWQNLDAARLILDSMVREEGARGTRARLEAARVIASLPDAFGDQLRTLLDDPDPEVARHAVRAAGQLGRRDLALVLLNRLADPRVGNDAVEALGKMGDRIIGLLSDYLYDGDVPIEVRREIPAVLLRINTQAAERVLMESLLQSDTTLRFRIITSLNKLRKRHPEFEIDAQMIEIVLAAEITGHYRSYQILGSLGPALGPEDPAVAGLRQSMDQEVERIFRLMGLLFPSYDLQSTYFGLRSDSALVRANALELLDNVLKPQLRSLLVPLFDSHVPIDERVRMADRVVGKAVGSREEAVAALVGSADPWLRSCGAYAVGALRLGTLEGTIDRWLEDPDPLLRETARAAKERLRDTAPPAEAAPAEAPPMGEGWESPMGVG